MNAGRFSLDHVGVVVADLDRAAATYRRLGFRLTARSSHKGPQYPGGPDELWGTGNHCVMFRQGYLELLGMTHPELPCTQFRRRLARYQGLQLVALGCADATATAAAVGARAALEAVAEFGRDVPYGDATRPGRFRIVHLADNDRWFPEGELFFIQHLTPEVLWQPELLAQPNRVTALVEATLCVADPAPTVARLERLLGLSAERQNSAWLSLSPGRLRVADPRYFAERYPQAALPPLPCVAAARYQVDDLAATRRCLSDNGVAFNSLDGAVWIEPQDAAGAVIEFSES